MTVKYITTPIFYANAGPHIGHAFTIILADAISIWTVIRGKGDIKTSMMTGTDEHGIKVAKAASAAGMDPLSWTNLMSSKFQALSKTIQTFPGRTKSDNGSFESEIKNANATNKGSFALISNRFIRTTDTKHIQLVQSMWKRLEDSGDIYLGKHRGWYCAREESFVNDRDVDKDLQCVRSDPFRKVIWVEEPNYMFKLHRYQDRILQWLQKKPSPIQPASRSEDIMHILCNSDGPALKDISISRQVEHCSWGIPVPGDPSQVIYVWLDALSSYLLNSNDDGASQSIPDLKGGPTIHVLGKDILKFHAIYWPAFLMAAGLELPQQLIVHGHWTASGLKMSKSVGNVVDPMQAFKALGNQTDPLRYYLLKEGRIDSDSDFSISTAREIYNCEVANQVGNLISRAFNPKFSIYLNHSPSPDTPTPSTDLVDFVRKKMQSASIHFDSYRFSAGIDDLSQIPAECNRLFTQSKIWENPTPPGVASIQTNLAYALVSYAIAMQPVMPEGSTKILDFFKIPLQNRFFPDCFAKLTAAPSYNITPLEIDKAATHLFPRLVDHDIN